MAQGIGGILGSLGSTIGSGAGSILSKIGGASPGQDVMGVLAGLGTGYDIYSAIQNQEARNQLKSLSNPANEAKDVAQLTQPLNQGLVNNVTNQVQGNLEQAGLSQSPALTTQAVSQALAPYYEENQSQALQEYQQQLQALQASMGGGGINVSPLWAALFGSSKSSSPLYPPVTILNQPQPAAPPSVLTPPGTTGAPPNTTPDILQLLNMFNLGTAGSASSPLSLVGLGSW